MCICWYVYPSSLPSFSSENTHRTADVATLQTKAYVMCLNLRFHWSSSCFYFELSSVNTWLHSLGMKCVHVSWEIYIGLVICSVGLLVVITLQTFTHDIIHSWWITINLFSFVRPSNFAGVFFYVFMVCPDLCAREHGRTASKHPETPYMRLDKCQAHKGRALAICLPWNMARKKEERCKLSQLAW